jgi:AcrR family transcriptional regulator
MPANQDTPAKILDGALRALARHGRRKLSMSDVCHEAGVSRGTLYRYFKSKEEVLEAIGQHVENGFRRAIQEAIAEEPNVEDRLRVVLDVIVHYNDRHPEAAAAIAAEPEFALAFFRREFPNHLAITREGLGPVLDQATVVREGVITKNQLAEIFLRIAMSTTLVPSPQSGKTPERIAALWAALTRPAKAILRKRSASG